MVNSKNVDQMMILHAIEFQTLKEEKNVKTSHVFASTNELC